MLLQCAALSHCLSSALIPLPPHFPRIVFCSLAPQKSASRACVCQCSHAIVASEPEEATQTLTTNFWIMIWMLTLYCDKHDHTLNTCCIMASLIHRVVVSTSRSAVAAASSAVTTRRCCMSSINWGGSVLPSCKGTTPFTTLSQPWQCKLKLPLLAVGSTRRTFACSPEDGALGSGNRATNDRHATPVRIAPTAGVCVVVIPHV